MVDTTTDSFCFGLCIPLPKINTLYLAWALGFYSHTEVPPNICKSPSLSVQYPSHYNVNPNKNISLSEVVSRLVFYKERQIDRSPPVC